MKTSAIRKHEPTWHILDANEKVVGRLATKAADLLRGKGKISFVQNMDCGDHVVIINAKSLVLTGNKAQDKAYHHYSGFHGGLKTVLAKQLIEEAPEKIIESAVKGMLPKNKLQNEWMKRLHVYAGSEHPHQANVAALPVE
ncbi:MAG: 50S ribosomal protein L13 [bacterium]